MSGFIYPGSPQIRKEPAGVKVLLEITDHGLQGELLKIMTLKFRAILIAEHIRENSFKPISTSPENNTDLSSIAMSHAQGIKEFDGKFGRFLADFSQGDKIVLTRILETTAMMGLKVLDVLEKTIEITKEGGSIKLRKTENPWKDSILGIFRKANVYKGFAWADDFNGHRRKQPIDNCDDFGTLTKDQIGEAHNTTILAAVQEFREMMEKTLKAFGFPN